MHSKIEIYGYSNLFRPNTMTLLILLVCPISVIACVTEYMRLSVHHRHLSRMYLLGMKCIEGNFLNSYLLAQ